MRIALNIVMVLIALGAFLYMNADRMLTAYGSMFIVDNPKKSERMLILGGSVFNRTKKAMELYRRGYGERVLLTRVNDIMYPEWVKERHPDMVMDENTLVAELLRREGVPFRFLDTTIQATSTFDEAWELVRDAEKHDYKSVIIVTSDYHTMRARYAFRKVLDKADTDLSISMAAAPNDIFDETNWWKTEAGLKRIVVESFAYIFYLFHSSTVDIVKPH
ncbi:YdcF family protein [Limisalsivibrio acetivorans]|uniref:YdcF family protein n=1 Tax=Limisalsivibrio acetivorans TaxID=1304888 RepID=UPI0003B51F96|nr:YdcF family protein [Limisalsivibrio acetivorans]